MSTETTHHLTAERLTAALAEVAEILVVGTYGQGYHAEVKYDATGQLFNVYDHGQLIASCDSALAAVGAFNGIRPKAVSR